MGNERDSRDDRGRGFATNPATARRAFIALALLLGVVMRVYDLGERSLWADEAWAALKVLKPTLRAALVDDDPRHYLHPPAFAAAAHLLTRALGGGEAVLRAIPCLAGIGSMFLIFFLARRWIGPPGDWAALAAVAFDRWAVIYSREFKQYSSDAFAVLALLLLGDVGWARGRTRDRIGVVVLCAACVWFSQTTVFVVPGLVAVWLWTALREKSARNAAWAVGAGAAGAASFGLNYALVVTRQRYAGLTGYWDAYLGRASSPFEAVAWLGRRTYDVADYLFSPHAGGVFLALGVIGLILGARARPRAAFLIWTPVALAGVAGLLRQYPFGGTRTVLFLLPLLVLGAAVGVREIFDRLRFVPAAAANGVLGAALLLWSWPAVDASLMHPIQVEEARPVIAGVERDLRPGDVLYVYPDGIEVFQYYYKGDPSIVTYGEPSREDVDGYRRQIDRLVRPGGRFWFVLVHFQAGGRNDAEVFFNHLTARCRVARGYQEPGATAMLAVCPPGE